MFLWFLPDLGGPRKTFKETVKQTVVHDYACDPVSIIQFIGDPYYLGGTLLDSIFKPIEHDLVKLFDGEYSEVLLKGA